MDDKITLLAIDLLSDCIREENPDLYDIPIDEVKRVIKKNLLTALAELVVNKKTGRYNN